MFWWIASSILVALAIRWLWRTYTHRSQVLVRQAANMDWVAAGTVKDSAGVHNVRLIRAGQVAVVSFRNENVELVEPHCDHPFTDFIEIERWLATKEQEYEPLKTNDPEVAYYQSISVYIEGMGHKMLLLEAQGTDSEFCEAVMKAQKAGYLGKQSAKVVGALCITAANYYKDSKPLGIEFLKKLEANLSATPLEPAKSTIKIDLDEASEKLTNCLEDAAETAHGLLSKIAGSRVEATVIKFHAQVLVYAAVFLAMSDRGMLPEAHWNTFKAGVENQMLAIKGDGSVRSWESSMPSGTEFAHFTSGYWNVLTDIERIVMTKSRPEHDAVTRHFIALLNGNPANQSEFQRGFQQLKNYAAVCIVPPLLTVFS